LQVGNKKWQVFLIVAVGVFLSTLDSSMVNIALPAIMADFHSTLLQTEWVVMAYLLTITTSLLFFGHLADRLGRGRIYSLGMIVFALGSLFCAMSRSFLWLICARFFQAGGAAMMMATGPALIKQAFPPQQLGRGQGLIGIAVSFGLMSGPSLGGFLIHFFSWRSLFLLSVPIGLLASGAAIFYLPRQDKSKGLAADFDRPGGLLWLLLLVSASLLLTHSSYLAGITVAGAVFLIILLIYWFIKTEHRVAQPVFPLALFKEKYFSIGIICALISFLVLFFALILIPFYLSNILEFDSSRIGLVMLAIPLAALLVAPGAGWLADYIGAKILSTLGLALLALSLFLLSGLDNHSTAFTVWLKLVGLGVGQSLFLSPNSSSVLGRSSKEQSGTVAALLATARNLGMMLGIGLSGLSFSFFFRYLSGGLDMKDFSPDYAGDFVTALKWSFLGAMVIALLGMIISWQRPGGGRQRFEAKK
jgi:EmrB/QacA subfamily drug resistance transporter